MSTIIQGAARIGRFEDPSVGPKFLGFSTMDLKGAFFDAVTKAFGKDVEDDVRILQPKSGRGFILELRLDQLTVDIPELGGKLTPLMWLRNANDGTRALTTGGGLFIWVCQNGAYIGLAAYVQKLRHVNGPKAHGVLDVLPSILDEQARRIASGETLHVALDALDTPVLDPVSLVASLPGVSDVNKDKAIYRILTGTHREKDNPGNAWGLYNLVNELVRRGGRSSFQAAQRDMPLLGDILQLAEDQSAERGAA